MARLEHLSATFLKVERQDSRDWLLGVKKEDGECHLDRPLRGYPHDNDLEVTAGGTVGTALKDYHASVAVG